MNMLYKDLFSWCDEQFQEQLSLLKTLAAIPAPSHHEEKRAEFIRDWLIQNGAQNPVIDSAKNVILSLGNTNLPMFCVMAHTDVVFSDITPLPVREERGLLYAPGVGDDTANVVALMLCCKYFLRHPEMIPEPFLIVFNSCEEGLGNLKGVRQVMSDYAGKIHSFVSFDCQSDSIVTQAVGSERWKVRVTTRGGHSFSDFGNPSAIAHLSALIGRLYAQNVPHKENCTTTYNVGLITGGTSVNTIAQSAEMMYEYRSDDRDTMAFMAAQFHRLLSDANTTGVQVSSECIGIRPCGGDIPEEEQRKLLMRCRNALSAVYPETVPFCAASTDANIPLSLGIPAATFGLYRGGGAHTREEYVRIDSLTPGLKVAMAFFLNVFSSEESVDFHRCP